jgi:lysyl-tRNA synthetase class 2
MKRLLAAGSGAIYQLGKVFRQGEAGRRHNPEFTLLEWYRPGFDHRRLMQEVEELLRTVLDEYLPLGPGVSLGYRQAFLDYAGIDPLTASATDLAARAAALGIEVSGLALDDPDPWRDLLLTQVVEPALPRDRPVFLYDYPASQAALARIRPGAEGEPPVAERFELYLNGLELANGFHELADAAEQRRRFEEDNAARQRAGLPVMPLDEALLAALEAGLPDCAGVALGVDRLVMLAAGISDIREVLAFEYGRA